MISDPGFICTKMVAALYNISQWEVFLRILYNELIKSSKQIETLNNKLEEIYKQIQMAVQMRTAVPTRQVRYNESGSFDVLTILFRFIHCS